MILSDSAVYGEYLRELQAPSGTLNCFRQPEQGKMLADFISCSLQLQGAVERQPMSTYRGVALSSFLMTFDLHAQHQKKPMKKTYTHIISRVPLTDKLKQS